ncbi:TOBE domain-containing protein [Methylovulum psychrotolerans]|jgi:molybdopterin-binding protein|uniref:Transporter n=1 Tax=Methylovulum psychrotolerans TaxID=1704499 RepID=A0A1Z4BWS2_9GAMM|nr:TOBE domain-containing protein [Methylovulum psychrotolerans]ASF45756.1 transporter [Methylovulum psychrotolerans]MBT9099610.1 TOBE domain-containing protein [Methylovulum psychrotolerans]POZ50228.1 transporter [Methylovulum psychrotolerans]
MNTSEVNGHNQIKGKIRTIHTRDVLSEIELDTAAGIITSIITTSSLKTLGLAVGQEAVALVKTTQFALAKP